MPTLPATLYVRRHLAEWELAQVDGLHLDGCVDIYRDIDLFGTHIENLGLRFPCEFYNSDRSAVVVVIDMPKFTAAADYLQLLRMKRGLKPGLAEKIAYNAIDLLAAFIYQRAWP